MKKYFQNKKKWQRVLYTLCFFALCLIDWIKGSLNGRTQMTATNMTGIVIAIMIFSGQKIKTYIKSIYVIWIVVCIIAIPIGVCLTLSFYPYKGQVITAAFNIVLYGAILINLLIELIHLRQLNTLKVPLLVGWLAMLTLMLVSVNENIWPIWYAAVFGSFYITEFDKDTEESIMMSIPNGIILGFFIIQGAALLFRPYDVVRYSGLYINPNFNALFYLMSYSALLCKWYQLIKERKFRFLRVIVCALSSSMYGFCVYTGSKTAILGMLVVTVPFSVLMLRHCKNRILSFLRCWLLLGFIGILSVPIVYGAIRYLPTIHLHPLYFEGEYSPSRVQPGESRESSKYISFEWAMESNMGRYFYKFPKLREYFGTYLTIKVKAAELDDYSEQVYIFSEEEVAEGIDPVNMRLEISKYFFKRLNLIGHSNYYEGAPVYEGSREPHAHNVFIQMAFLYGIPAGILFIAMTMIYIPECIILIKSGEDYRACLISCFILAFVVFGFFEIDWMCGQLPFTLFFFLFRDVVRSPRLAREL